MAEIKIDYTNVRNPQLRRFFENDFKDVLFSIIDGHDHDGTNSKALAPDAVVTTSIVDLNVTAGKLAANAVETAKIKDANVTIAKLEAKGQPTTAAIADPGNAGAIAVTNSGTCPLVSAGAETRTIAAPTFAGQRIVLACKTYVGNIVVTASAAINQTGNTTITLNGAGDFIELVGVELGGAKVWRVSANDGCALSTP